MFWTVVWALIFVFVGLPIIVSLVCAILNFTFEYASFVYRYIAVAIISLFLLFLIFGLFPNATFNDEWYEQITIVALCVYGSYELTQHIVPSGKRIAKKNEERHRAQVNQKIQRILNEHKDKD